MTRDSGIGWGTGEDISSDIWDILSSDSPTILNEPEARHHWADVNERRPGGLTIWRASPQASPAERNWDAHAFSRDIFINLDLHNDDQGEYPTDILLLNELNLSTERGDKEDDTDPSMWAARYAHLAQFQAQLLTACKERAADRGFTPNWWYPGWAPGHGEYDHAGTWGPVAALHDGICFHAYGSAEVITEAVLWYSGRFPNHPICLSEWNVPS